MTTTIGTLTSDRIPTNNSCHVFQYMWFTTNSKCAIPIYIYDVLYISMIVSKLKFETMIEQPFAKPKMFSDLASTILI